MSQVKKKRNMGNLANGTTRCRPKPSCRKHQTQRGRVHLQPQMRKGHPATNDCLVSVCNHSQNANLQSLTHAPKHNPSKIAEIDQKPSKPFFVLKLKLTILKNFGLSRRSGFWGFGLPGARQILRTTRSEQLGSIRSSKKTCPSGN